MSDPTDWERAYRDMRERRDAAVEALRRFFKDDSLTGEEEATLRAEIDVLLAEQEKEPR